MGVVYTGPVLCRHQHPTPAILRHMSFSLGPTWRPMYSPIGNSYKSHLLLVFATTIGISHIFWKKSPGLTPPAVFDRTNGLSKSPRTIIEPLFYRPTTRYEFLAIIIVTIKKKRPHGQYALFWQRTIGAELKTKENVFFD